MLRRTITLCAALLAAFSLCCAIAAQFPCSAVVKKSNVNMRSKGDITSDIVTVLDKGDELSVSGQEGSWYAVTAEGFSGYIRKDMLTLGEAQDNAAQPSTGDIILLDDGSEDIASDESVPDELELLADSSDSAYSPAYSPAPIGDGTLAGAMESALEAQRQLQLLGFYSGKLDGKFGTASNSALKAFQYAYGMPVTGQVDQLTYSALTQYSAYGGNGTSAAAVAVKDGVTLSEWFNYVKKALPKYEHLRCIDVRTGTEFKLRAFACGSHADVEPPTKEDTQAIFSANGNKWSWDPRPIIVFIEDKPYAAAINVQPHGPDTLPDNGMEGQLCMHFLYSRQHNTGDENDNLQDAVLFAYENGGALLQQASIQ